jgi:cell division protein FtsB
MQSRRFDFAVSVVCLALLGYFAWHANKGPRGYGYHENLQAKTAILQSEFDSIQQSRVRLEHKVGLLRPESLDPDMLDEVARRELEAVSPGELVAYQKP